MALNCILLSALFLFLGCPQVGADPVDESQSMTLTESDWAEFYRIPREELAQRALQWPQKKLNAYRQWFRNYISEGGGGSWEAAGANGITWRRTGYPTLCARGWIAGIYFG